MTDLDRRRICRVRIDVRLWTSFLVGNLANCRCPSMISSVPEDLQVYAIIGPVNRIGPIGEGEFEIYVWSSTFEPVPDGEAIPELEVTFGPDPGFAYCPICGKRLEEIESERYDSNGAPLPAWICGNDHTTIGGEAFVWPPALDREE